MPRDGLSQYAPPPGTNGITNYTIESTKYNGFVADVTQDLNLPRPIVAGGTGAVNAHDAMVNLSGEIAQQIVTNFDSFPFVPGSFSAAAGATSAPVAGHAFAGICYQSGPTFQTLEARDLNDSVVPGRKYVRQSNAGVWGAWSVQAGSVADLDAAYVNVSGDTMTGPLAVAGQVTASVFDSSITGAPTQGSYYFGNAGNKYLNWDGTQFNLVGGQLTLNAGSLWIGQGTATALIYFGSTATKNLNFDGTNFVFSGGALYVANQIYSGLTSTTGQYQFGASGTKYLNYDGSLYHFAGGDLKIDAGNLAIVHATVPTSGYCFLGNTNTKYLNFDGTNFNLIGGKLAVPGGQSIQISGTSATVFGNALGISYLGGGSQYGIELRPAADTTVAIAFVNSVGSLIGNIGAAAGSVSYNTTSDARLKEDLKSFDAGNIIDQTNVYDFAWKKTGERSYGVIAQQAVEVYPMAVTHSVPDEGDDFWGVDYSKYVPVLLQELKALRARVAQLEGRLDAKPA